MAKKRKKGKFCLKEGFRQSGEWREKKKVFLKKREGREKGAEKGVEGWKGMKTQKKAQNGKAGRNFGTKLH